MSVYLFMSAHVHERERSKTPTDFIEYIDLENGQVIVTIAVDFNDTEYENASSLSSTNTTILTIPEEIRQLYIYVDTNLLNVSINDVEKSYDSSVHVKIEPPPPGLHPYTRLLDVKGNTDAIIYNRLPVCHEYTMRTLLQLLSEMHSYTYAPSEIYVPFAYNFSILDLIARSINAHGHKALIYERHIYFFDFHTLRIPDHPVWINLVQDPIYRLAAEYQRSREICRTLGRCFIREDTLNETLDECVAHRSPTYCISPDNGISRMVPFFCGLKYPWRCLEDNYWIVEQAKKNIDNFYTVIGVAEEFYKFLYVLEKLLPRYFRFARLVFMNYENPALMADPRDLNVTLPNANTTEILKPLLSYEYEVYDYIKSRFMEQYRVLTELED